MNRWDKQHVAGWTRTNRAEWATYSGMGGLSLTLEQGQDGRIREVLQGVAAQVCMDV
jgi:hypothetical protein